MKPRSSPLRSPLAAALTALLAGCATAPVRTSPPSVKQAVWLYEKACGRGIARGCAAYGALLAEGWGVPRDEKKAFDYFVEACEGGDKLGLVNLGALYSRTGDVVASDDRLAYAIFQQTCEAGLPLACANLGTLVAQGRGTPADEVRAMALFSRACDGQSAEGCYDLATRLEIGSDGARAPERAIPYFQRACDLGYGRACSDLGALLELGIGVAADAKRAAELYAVGCERGAPMGCARLGLLYEAGRGVAKDPRRARLLHHDACSQGAELGCARYAALTAAGRPAAAAPLPPPRSPVATSGAPPRPAAPANPEAPVPPPPLPADRAAFGTSEAGRAAPLGWMEERLGRCFAAAHLEEVNACWSSASRGKGKLELAVTVDASGQVTKVSVVDLVRVTADPGRAGLSATARVGSAIGDPALERCVVDRVRTWPLPRAREGEATFRTSYRFPPEPPVDATAKYFHDAERAAPFFAPMGVGRKADP